MGIDREIAAKFLQTEPDLLEDTCQKVLGQPVDFIVKSNFSHDEVGHGAHTLFLQIASKVLSEGRRQRLLETPGVNS